MAEQPMFRAFSIIKRENSETPFWLNIGVAFMHKDDQGLNIILQALPLDGKVVLRPFEMQPQGPQEKKTDPELGNTY